MSGHMREFAVHPDEHPDHHHPRLRRLQHDAQMPRARPLLPVLRTETDKLARRVKHPLGNSPPTLPENLGERRKENGASVRMKAAFTWAARRLQAWEHERAYARVRGASR